MISANFTEDVTGTNNVTIFIEDGQVVYPCSCGKTHRGDYALEDFIHHNCLHPSPLIDLGYGPMCGDCGQVWAVRAAMVR